MELDILGYWPTEFTRPLIIRARKQPLVSSISGFNRSYTIKPRLTGTCHAHYFPCAYSAMIRCVPSLEMIHICGVEIRKHPRRRYRIRLSLLMSQTLPLEKARDSFTMFKLFQDEVSILILKTINGHLTACVSRDDDQIAVPEQ